MGRTQHCIPKLWWWRHVIFLIVCIAAVVGVARAVNNGNDFTGFHEAAAHFWNVGTPSGDKSVERYPPTFAALLAPLGAMPLWLAVVVWQGLNVLALMHLPLELRRLSHVRVSKQWPAWFAATPFIVANLTLAQSGPILLYLITLAIARSGLTRRSGTKRGSLSAAGAAIGVAAAMKVLPGAFAPLAALRSRSARPVVFAGLVVAALLVLAAARQGVGVTVNDSMRWWQEIRNDQSPLALAENGRSMRPNNQSLAAVLFRTLTDSPGRQPPGTQWASLDRHTVLTIYHGVVAIAGAAWIFLAWAALRTNNPSATLGLFALTSMGMLLLSPIVWTHYFIWLLPAMLYLQRRPRLLLWGSIISIIGLTSDTLRSLGIHMLATLAAGMVIASEIWAARLPWSMPMNVRTLLTGAPPSALAGAAMVVFTALSIACALLLPEFAQEVYSDHLLEPIAVINLAIAAAVSYWLSSARAIAPAAQSMWKIFAAALAFATLDNTVDVHDWVYDGVLVPLAQAIAGRPVFLGGDDVVVIGYATALALIVGWRFRHEFMRQRCMTVLFALSGLLLACMALCDESTGMLSYAEGPCEAAATALVLAAICVSARRAIITSDTAPPHIASQLAH